MDPIKRKSKSTFKLLTVAEILERPEHALYDAASVFRIDAHLAAAPALSAWDREAKKQVGRRTIEVALMRCEDAASELQLSVHREDWKRVAAASATAHRAIAALGTALSGETGSATPRGLLPPFKQMAAHVTQQKENSVDGKRQWALTRPLWAVQKAAQFCEAEKLVAEIHHYLAARAHEIKHDKNLGEVAKVAFVFTMAELWMFMSGKRPGSGPNRNPFLRLVADAWEDVGGGPDESFAQALRQTLKRLTNESVESPPSWL